MLYIDLSYLSVAGNMSYASLIKLNIEIIQYLEKGSACTAFLHLYKAVALPSFKAVALSTAL